MSRRTRSPPRPAGGAGPARPPGVFIFEHAWRAGITDHHHDRWLKSFWNLTGLTRRTVIEPFHLSNGQTL